MDAILAIVIPIQGGIPGLTPGYPLPTPPVYPSHGLPGAPVYPSHGLPGAEHPGNALPTPPVRPSNPIVLPPGVWPPTLPPGVDNSLPPGQGGAVSPPIYIPPDPDLGIEQPIYLPTLPTGTALVIALPQAQPKAGTPTGTQPALLVQPGKKPVLVYVTGAPQPK